MGLVLKIFEKLQSGLPKNFENGRYLHELLRVSDGNPNAVFITMIEILLTY